MRKKYIINYWPGSLGDSLITHIFPNISSNIEKETGRYKVKDVLHLKNIDLEIDDLKHQIDNFNGNVISSHFINLNMNYSQLIDENTTIIHINPSKLESIIAYRGLYKTHKQSISKLYLNLSDKSKIIRITKNIINWKNSIPEDDITISLYDLLKYKQNYFESWKIKNNLTELITPTDQFFIHAEASFKIEI